MNRYTFNILTTTTITIDAPSVGEAEDKLRTMIESSTPGEIVNNHESGLCTDEFDCIKIVLG